jgi:hypothetical protein
LLTSTDLLLLVLTICCGGAVGVLDVGMDLWTDVMVFSVVDLGCCYDRCCCRLRKRLAEAPLMEFFLLLLLLMMNILFFFQIKL